MRKKKLSSSLSILQSRFPEATKDECYRFLSGFPEEAEERLSAYLQWRRDHQLPLPTSALPSGSLLDDDDEHSSDFEDAEMYGNHIDLENEALIEQYEIAFVQSLLDAEPADSNADDQMVQSIWDNNNNKQLRRSETFLTALTETSVPDVTRSDAQDWKEACACALAAVRSKRLNGNESFSEVQASQVKRNRFRRRPKQQAVAQPPIVLPSTEDEIPQMLFCHTLRGLPIRDSSGHRILHHLPAQIDMQVLSENLFVTCVALYLDRKLRRDDDELLTLLIDVRPGDGWPNPPAVQMVQFIRTVAQQLHALYPQRLHRCILYPVPRPAFYLWHTIRPLLHALVSKHIVLIPGAAALESPPPMLRLKTHVNDAEALELIEQTRVNAFVTN